jgi:hypothetical protein
LKFIAVPSAVWRCLLLVATIAFCCCWLPLLLPGSCCWLLLAPDCFLLLVAAAIAC